MTKPRFTAFPIVAPSTLLSIAALAAAALPVHAAPSENARGAAPAKLEAYASNRILIEPRAGLSPANLEKILKVHKGVARRLGKSDVHVVDLPAGAANAVAKLLERHPQLKMVELDRVVFSTALPNDPYLGSAWHLGKVGAAAAWESANGMGDGIKIAILDSGVESAHPDLAGNLVPGYNYVDWIDVLTALKRR